jgi:deazaflavin-dependent oxidoreductase (nitroreductase family)
MAKLPADRPADGPGDLPDGLKERPVVPRRWRDFLVLPQYPWAYRIDRSLLKWTGVSYMSRQAARMRGDPPPEAIVLTTIGRSTGLLRAKTVSCTWYGDALVVVGSNSGKHYHPDWYVNLQAHPTCWVRLHRADYAATARTLDGDERSRVLAATTESRPHVVVYDRAVAERGRQMPVVLIEFPYRHPHGTRAGRSPSAEPART